MKEHNYNELKQTDIVRYLKENIRPSFNAAEFDWEFKTFNNAVFKLYSSDERLVASQAMLPVKLIVNSQPVATAKSETSFLNKDYRGNNHFENLYFSAIKKSRDLGFQIIWGFTPAVKVWKMKLNFDVVKSNISEAAILISKYPSNSFLKKYVSNKVILILKVSMFSLLRILERRPQYLLTQTSLEVNSAFPATNVLQEFQERLSEKFNLKVYLDLNEEYINWRIRTNPILKYQTCFFYNKSNLAGYVIFSIKDDRLSIADLSYLESGIGIHILGYILNQHSGKINSVFYFGNDDSEYGKNIFETFAHYKAQINKSDWANTVIKDISDDDRYKSVLDPSGWFINGMWTEGFSI